MTSPTDPRRRQVLADPALDRRLALEGYVATPCLSSDEVDGLLTAYERLRPADDTGLVIDFLRDDRRIMREVEALLAPIWAKRLPMLFADHRIAVATFVTKHPGDDSAMLLHEEPSFVDERTHRSHALWIPLVDVAAELDNGHLLVLPGSAGLERGTAGFNTPVQHRPYEALIMEHLVPVRAKAGTAVIYDSRTLHGSVANRSAVPRPAIAASVVPIGAPVVHVVATGRRGRRVHRVPDDFYVDRSPMSFDPLALDEPVLVELEEHASLDPADLARLLDVPVETVHAAPLVPADVLGALGVDQLSSLVGDRAAPMEGHDVRCSAAELAGSAPTDQVGLGWHHRAEVGAWGSQLPAGVRDAVEGVVGVGTASDVAVLDPGGRLELLLHGAGVTVVDGPLVNAGLACARGVVPADPGNHVQAGSQDRVVAWNEGPGPLVLAVVPGVVGPR